MKKKKVRFVLGLVLMLFGFMLGSRQVDAAGSYKVVYHFSTSNSTKVVIKKVKCGQKFTILSGSALKFTQKNKYLIAWIARRQPSNLWAVKKNSVNGWARYNKKALCYYSPGTQMNGNYRENEIIHLYGYWVNINNIDVTAPPFSANGKDTEADHVAIQRALDIANDTKSPITVKIPSGNYYLGNGLSVYSNTTLKLSAKAKMMRAKKYPVGTLVQVGYLSYVENNIGGYNQAKNVTIDGGRWVGDPANGFSDAAVMRFHHCNNIVLKNGIIENYSGKHGVVFVAANNVLVDSMTFQNQKLTPGSEFDKLIQSKPQSAKNGEAIHTDFADAEDAACPYDGTICDKVVISNCLISNTYSGIGNHKETTNKGTSYVICNNTFKNIKYNCLNMYTRDKVEIYSNKMTNCGAFLEDVNSTFNKLEYPVNTSGTVSSILKKNK